MIETDCLPVLEGRRILLRWLTERDLDALFAIFSHDEVMRFWSEPAFADRTRARRLLDRIHDGFRRKTLFQWGVVLKDGEDVPIGTCTLSRLDAANRRAEIGFVLNRPFWGEGYMSEALRVLLDFAFGPLNLHRIEADVDPRNGPSLRLLRRLGFRSEGHLRERWLVNGEAQDSLFLGLLRREWLADRD